jgi:hypothetical protein
MRKYAFVVLFVFICIHVDAQQNGLYHSLSINPGDYNLADASIDTKLDGKRLGVGYEVMKKDRTRMSTLAINWNGSSINTSSNKYNLNEFSLRFSDGFKIGVNRFGRFNAFVGYGLHLNPSFIKITGKDDRYYTWTTVNTLGIYQSYQYNWNRQSITLDVYVPVVGGASRPDMVTVYPDDVNGLLFDSYSKLELISWDNYKDIEVKLGYHRELTSRWHLNAGAQYRYMELETSLPVNSRLVGVEAGVSFKVR